MSTHRSAVSHGFALAVAFAFLATGCPPSASLSSTAPPAPPLPRASGSATPSAASAGPTSPRPKLVVLLVVDQLPSWTFSRHLKSFRGGFARLVREGVFWPHGAYPYAATITAIGHTALATGAEPHRSGIVGNAWWDQAAGRWIDVTEDHAQLTIPSHANDDGASPHSRLVEAVGLGRNVLSVSYKERAAVLMAPSKGAVVAWYEPQQAAFVTGTAYANERPAWLEKLAREHPIAPRLDYVWTPLEATPGRALVGDVAAGEVDKYGLGTSFPHRLVETASKRAFAVGATPLATEILLEAVLAGIDAVSPELLDVSFSAHDLSAHLWGQESWEATDILFRMDDTIGKLFDGLDARYGKVGWSLVFASDHGGPTMPERNPGALRVDVADVEKVVAAAAGAPKSIATLDERMIYLSPTARALPDAARGKMLDRIVTALKGIPGVGFAMRTDSFRTNVDCTGLPELESLVCRSVYGERSGDIYYGPREHSIVMPRPFMANLHGTPYDYDRNVPIIVRESGRAPRMIEDETPSLLRVASTVARLLGAPPPPAAREPSL